MDTPNNANHFAVQANHPENKIIAITSGKEGIGKTWLSITLAQALSGLKQKTLFFDGDLGPSNIDAQLGLMIEADLASVIHGHKTLNQIVRHSDKGHFDVIAGRSGSSGLLSIPIGRLQIFGEDLKILSSNYDKIILDMGSGIENGVKILSGMSGHIVVLCTEEAHSLTEAYAFIKAITQEYPSERKISIVVNQANSKEEGYRTYDTLMKACRNFLGLTPPLLGVIRRDTRIRDAIRNQSPLISRYPTSEASEDVISIARRILKDE